MEQVVGSAQVASEILKGLKSVAGNDTKIFGSMYRELSLIGWAAEDIPATLRIIGDTAAMMPEGIEAGMSGLVDLFAIVKESGSITEKQIKSLAD